MKEKLSQYNHKLLLRLFFCFSLILLSFQNVSSQTWYSFDLNVSIGGVNASTSVLLNSRMTSGLDVTYDAGLLRSGSGVEVYTRLVNDNGVDFAIQCLPSDFDSFTIPVGIESKKTGVLTVSDELKDIPENVIITFEDKTTGTLTRLDGAMNLAINVTAGLAGIGRFYLYVEKIEIIKDTTVVSGDEACFDAVNTLSIAGDGSSVIVENNATANFISSGNIVFLPGFHAEEGSNVRGYIGGPEDFCTPVLKSVDAEVQEEQSYVSSIQALNDKFKIYFSEGFIQLSGEVRNGSILGIYDIGGRKLGEHKLMGGSLNSIPTSGLQSGVYLLRVLDCSELYTGKIVVRQ